MGARTGGVWSPTSRTTARRQRRSRAPTPSSTSRRSPPRRSAPRLRRSGSMPSRPTTCSRRRSRRVCVALRGASSETVLGLPLAPHRRSPRSTRGSSRDPRAVTRSRSSSARRWRPSAVGGPGSRSSDCGSRTSWSRMTTPRSRRIGPTPGSAAGTCGATSIAAMSRKPADSPSRRRSPGLPFASSPRPIP